MATELNFVLGLEDQLSPDAKKASQALRQLSTELTGSKAKLALYQQQLSQARQLGDVDGYRKYTKLVAEARRDVFQLGEAMVAAGGPAQKLGKDIGQVSGKIATIKEPAKDATAHLTAMFLGLGSISAIGSIFRRVADDIVHSLEDIARATIETALRVTEVNARLVATFEALGEGPGAGQKTLDFLNDLSSKLPQSRDQLAQWAIQYQALGITDLGELRNQIRATASAQAIAGDEGAEAYKNLTERIHIAIEEH